MGKWIVPCKCRHFTRREFLRRGAAAAAGLPFLSPLASAFADTPALAPDVRSKAKVAIAQCRQYGAPVRPALQQCLESSGVGPSAARRSLSRLI